MLRGASIAIASLLLGGCSSDANLPGGTAGSGGGSIGSGGIGAIGGAAARRHRQRRHGGAGGGSGGTGGMRGRRPTGSLVFKGRLPKLLNFGPSCTFEAGATDDRWCGFFADSTNPIGTVELFVVNVTKAAAGVPITCGLPDANCLKLAAASYQDDSHPEVFQGDTLVYYDTAGTPFGWRPGMPEGRPLAVADSRTKDLSLCIAAVKGTAVTCLRVLPLTMQTIQNVLLADLLAGRIDGAANPPLATIETVGIAASGADRERQPFPGRVPRPPGGDIARVVGARGPQGGRRS